MNILAIETSCDETAIAILDIQNTNGDINARILANIIQSQIKIHAQYGGVFPSLAKREHAKNLMPILITALKESRLFAKADPLLPKENFLFAEKLLEKEPGLLVQFLKEIPSIKKPNIDAMAVTYGPGLEPALWVGVNFAKALSLAWNIPIIAVNHMEGHIFSALLKAEKKISNSQFLISKKIQNIKYKIQNIQFPAIALLVSGGHTELVLIKDMFKYDILGQTRDDAVGEAFDKVARMLALPYPGGQEVSKRADSFRADQKQNSISLPRPMLNSNDCDFSFSGLKTAVLYLLDNLKKDGTPLTEELIAEICHEFQSAVTEVLVTKTMKAISKNSPRMLLVGGGVSANMAIRKALEETLAREAKDITLFLPNPLFTGDNAAMIALAAYFKKTYVANKKTDDFSLLVASGNVRIDTQKMPVIFLPQA